jgi:hypothetical protein
VNAGINDIQKNFEQLWMKENFRLVNKLFKTNDVVVYDVLVRERG